MTEISFHFNVPNRTAYACRLLRKALRRGSAVVAIGPEACLAEVDRELWTFEADEFLPHARIEQIEEVPTRLRPRTVWLSTQAIEVPVHDVLVNLGNVVPSGFETFDRVVEIVSSDDADRISGRERWKRYASRGYVLNRHSVTA